MSPKPEIMRHAVLRACAQVWDHHTEFAVGLDFSTLAEGVMASVGWDEMAFVWHQSGDPRSATL